MNHDDRARVMTREDFLRMRQQGTEAAKRAWTAAGQPDNHIIMDPDEEVICDDCNAEITEPVITLVAGGSRAVCLECFGETWAGHGFSAIESMLQAFIETMEKSIGELTDQQATVLKMAYLMGARQIASFARSVDPDDIEGLMTCVLKDCDISFKKLVKAFNKGESA